MNVFKFLYDDDFANIKKNESLKLRFEQKKRKWEIKRKLKIHFYERKGTKKVNKKQRLKLFFNDIKNLF